MTGDTRVSSGALAREAREAREAPMGHAAQAARPIPASEGVRPREEWRASKSADWVAWLRGMVLRAHYAHLRAGAPTKLTVHWRDWSEASGVPVTSLHNYLVQGTQPTIANANGIAESLGLHPLAVMYRAGILSREQVWDLAGGGRVRSEDELRAEIASAEHMPEDYASWRESIIRHAETQLRLLQDLAIGDMESGAVASERVQREIRSAETPWQMPGDTPDAPAVTHRPGPRRRNLAPKYAAEDVEEE